MLGLTLLACRSHCIPRHELETWQQGLPSVQYMLHPQSTATGIINLPAQPHLLSSTKPIYFLLLQPTSYFKPGLKSKILLQSHQRCFLSTGHLLCLVSDCIGFYFIYFFPFTLVPMRKPAWTVERTEHWNHQKYRNGEKGCLSSSSEHVLVHLDMDVLSRPLLKIRRQAWLQSLGHFLVWSSG